MSAALQQALVRMQRNGLGGMSDEHATALVGALSQGTPLAVAAARAGLDARVSAAVLTSGAADVPEAVAGQARIAGMLLGNTRRMQSAGSYPLVLAAAVLLAGTVVGGVMAPALASLATPQSATALFAAVGVSAGLLALLSAAVLGRLRLPLVGAGWSMIHRAAFLESLAALTSQGAALPAAIRGASVWCLPDQKRAAEGLASALQAGRAAEAAPLLAPIEAAMLVGAARTGTVPTATEALLAQDRVRLARTLPGAILRIHTAALLLAGGAVLATGVAFFTVYSSALAGS